MKVDIKVDSAFEEAFNELKEKYGEELAELNGLGTRQLSGGDFIDNFIDKSTVADASIDSNANVRHKDVVSMQNEMNKPLGKLFSFNKIYHDMTKMFGEYRAREWLESEWIGKNYMHDAPSSTFVSYSYKGTETIVVKYNDVLYLTTFEDLYDMVDAPQEILVEKDGAYCKYTKELYVWDKDDEWTQVIRVIKKPKTNNFHWIKSANGLSEIVTSNHPIITTNGDKNAKDIVAGEDFIFTNNFDKKLFGNIDEIYLTDILDDIYFRGRPYDGEELENKDGQVSITLRSHGIRGIGAIQNRIKLDYDFGWMVGFVLAEGNMCKTSFGITQNDNEYLERAISICERKNWPYAIYEQSDSSCLRLQFQSTPLMQLFKYIIWGNKSDTKRLNPIVANYNKDFIRGVVAGVIDGDGTCTSKQGRRIHIRLTSRALINQLAFFMRSFGYTVREQTPCIYSHDSSFVSRKLIYHMAFTPTIEEEDFNSVKISTHRERVPYEREIRKTINPRYTFGYGEQKILNNEVLLEDNDKYVYDISVNTGHFMCNSILSHNCFAYDVSDVAEKGLFFIGDGFNAQPPKHLETFTDFVIEFTSYCCNRSSGAVGLPNFLIYSYYFWKKDCDTGYYIKSPEYYRDQEFQRIIYKLNQPYVRSGIQSAFTNFSIFDKSYIESLFAGKMYPDGEFIIDYVDELIEYEKAFMVVCQKVREDNVMTFPVLTFALLRKDNKFVDEEFAKWCCKHDMKWNDSNWFNSEDVTSLSNCCRLSSNIKDLGYFNSLGSTALKVGSVKVNTINLARLSYENSKDDYLDSLRKQVVLTLDALHTIRHIIKRNVEKGILPNYSNDLVDMSKQYNTIGIIGIYETLQKYGMTYKDKFGYTYYTKDGIDFAKEILSAIHEVKDEYKKDKDYMINIEQVPAERAAAVLMQKDMMFYPDERYELPLYGNQWIPLGVKTSIQEKVKLSAELDRACSGGSIMHCNVEAPFNNFDEMWKVLNYICDAGVQYFAFNQRISACKHNHGFHGDICPECGEPVDTTYQRIAGFLTPEKSYSKERKAEFRMRDWFDFQTMGEL